MFDRSVSVPIEGSQPSLSSVHAMDSLPEGRAVPPSSRSRSPRRSIRAAVCGDVVYHWESGRMGIVRQVDVDYIFLWFPAGGEPAWRRRSAFVYESTHAYM